LVQSELDECGAIDIKYPQEVNKATECTLGAADQCTKQIALWPDCQCPSFANGDTAVLTSLLQRYQELGCETAGCTVDCREPVPSTCEADATSSTGARCVPIRK
jgi:hypothetical protein